MAEPGIPPRHPSPGRHKVRGWRQAVGLIGAPAAWIAQISFDFVMADFACRAFSGIRLWLLLAGVASTAAGLFSLWTAWGAWKQTQGEAEGEEGQAIDIGEGRSRFFAMTGMLAGAIFTAASLFTLLAVIVVRPC